MNDKTKHIQSLTLKNYNDSRLIHNTVTGKEFRRLKRKSKRSGNLIIL